MNKIAIIGLGYVGLPLAIEFGKIRSVIGYDINERRINDLKNGFDATNEIGASDFKKSKNLSFTSNLRDLSNCSIFIVSLIQNQITQKALSPLLKMPFFLMLSFV